MLRQLITIRTEGVGFDQVCSRLNVLAVNARYLFG